MLTRGGREQYDVKRVPDEAKRIYKEQLLARKAAAEGGGEASSEGGDGEAKDASE